MKLKKCPKCEYVRSETDTAPEYECPVCGVVYAKFVALKAAERRAAHEALEDARQAELERQSQEERAAEAETDSRNAQLTKCRSCGGVVAWEAKVCPHCGQQKPAGKPPAKPMRGWIKWAGLAAAALVVASAIFGSRDELGLSSRQPVLTYGSVQAFDGTDDSISAALHYAALLGRANACGIDTAGAARIVGRWMGDAGPIIVTAFATRMRREAQLQHDGKTPDSCAAVRSSFAQVIWPE